MSLLNDRTWHYGQHTGNLYINQGIYPTSGGGDADFSVIVNGAGGIASACVGQSLIYNVFDESTFKPWKTPTKVEDKDLTGSGSTRSVNSH
jgi:hypothetical protein